VTVRLFAVARQRAGRNLVELELPGAATVGDLKRALAEKEPELAPLLPCVRVAVGSEYAAEDLVIPAGAEVAVIPPVSGGAADGEDEG
jgi:molybdopterin converting factor subunit 1